MNNMKKYIKEKQIFIEEFHADKQEITKSTYMDCYKYGVLSFELKKEKDLCEFKNDEIKEVFANIKTTSINVKRMILRFINDYRKWKESKLVDSVQYNEIEPSQQDELFKLNLKVRAK